MSNQVQLLYNDLFTLENRLHKSTYPIHKRLNAREDIYDSIIKLLSPINGKILDAGCGVGYGTQKIAAIEGVSVEGITISSSECDYAKSKNQYPNKCKYECKGFEDIAEQYDNIICVESLKHTLEFKNAIKKIKEAMTTNSKLVVVEDFFEGDMCEDAKRFMHDWELNYLISEKQLSEDFICEQSIDLTQYMHIKSKAHLNLKMIMYRLAFNKSSNYLKLLRGGTLLDSLYRKGKMRYKLNVYKLKNIN